ncbi:MAG: hypothetical protein GX327_03455 [Epulopiscium sp.]|nr:hypothetical protein [Candidatus Epulonipiscium sp.]
MTIGEIDLSKGIYADLDLTVNDPKVVERDPNGYWVKIRIPYTERNEDIELKVVMDASESIAQNGISNYNFDLLNVGEVVDTISPCDSQQVP